MQDFIKNDYCNFFLKVPFWGQKGALKTNISPYFWASLIISIG